MADCTGNGPDHCCYIDSVVCSHLEEHTVVGRRWACGLLVNYGSWQKVNRSAEYRPVGEHWVSIGAPFNYCETFQPRPDQCCRVDGGD